MLELPWHALPFPPMTRVSWLVAFAAALGLRLAVFTPAESAGCHRARGATFGGKCVIHMGGLFAFPGSPSIGMQQEVAQTALDHVNSLEGILDGYHLSMRWNWTGVSLWNPLGTFRFLSKDSVQADDRVH